MALLLPWSSYYHSLLATMAFLLPWSSRAYCMAGGITELFPSKYAIKTNTIGSVYYSVVYSNVNVHFFHVSFIAIMLRRNIIMFLNY